QQSPVCGPEVDELLHLPLRISLLNGSIGETVERAVRVALRDVRREDSLPPPQIPLTPARLHAKRIAGNGKPAGAVASGADQRHGDGKQGHGESSLAPRQHGDGMLNVER